jgi:alpha-L-fucosidase
MDLMVLISLFAAFHLLSPTNGAPSHNLSTPHRSARTSSTDQTVLSLPIAPGPFQPTMESLKGYKYPKWFRDAKFGIWAHWGPQSVPMEGDWYARQMYQQGSGDYKDHLTRYGHPSVKGYKDIIPLWKAEKWDPEHLMELYKKAGAKYFVSMGSHHDNFFLWKSKLHRWNAFEMGPHRDVVGDWQKAAKRNGLKFGVSEHLGASFTWFQPSHGSDKTGPKAGVPYDGADPKYADLYHTPAAPGDTGWYSTNPQWQQEWYREIKELVDNYHPDLLYSDGGVPFGNKVGLSMIAHFYNSNAAAHGGSVQAVYNCKQTSDGRWVEDLERGIMPKIDPNPWQTDTSIGDWFYNKHWKFRPVSWVIDMLVDNVSKNGNLLLNVVQRPDGSLDPEVLQMLKDLADWSAIHGEAIYGSRPWQVYGESAVRVKGGSFNESYTYTAKDIRFTTKGKTLYALTLGWPTDGKILVRSLARPAGSTANAISKVALLGYKGKLTWSQSPEGLLVRLPHKEVSQFTAGLKITGTHLVAIPFEVPVRPVMADADGNLTLLPGTATINGSHVQVEQKGGQPNLGFWDSPDESVSWKVKVPSAGRYEVSIDSAALQDSSRFGVIVAGHELDGSPVNTGDWSMFKESSLGSVQIDAAGVQTVELKPRDPATWKAINVRWVKLKRVP